MTTTLRHSLFAELACTNKTGDLGSIESVDFITAAEFAIVDYAMTLKREKILAQIGPRQNIGVQFFQPTGGN